MVLVSRGITIQYNSSSIAFRSKARNFPNTYYIIIEIRASGVFKASILAIEFRVYYYTRSISDYEGEKPRVEALRQIYVLVLAINLVSKLREFSSFKTTLGNNYNIIVITILRAYNSEFYGPLVLLELGGNLT
ncbi:uncharacterized protein RCO7_14023 [Rhynchosporium graminicola]|uniref:Uncharacterized protein n=1 Tax=Rhynchosporium graminicola TaxID=2792576 RepID=A0A1E1KT00_9HELO|nr:uncharacterized protein RCO7_14023 [Rhynchosporium commune]